MRFRSTSAVLSDLRRLPTVIQQTALANERQRHALRFPV